MEQRSKCRGSENFLNSPTVPLAAAAAAVLAAAGLGAAAPAGRHGTVREAKRKVRPAFERSPARRPDDGPPAKNASLRTHRPRRSSRPPPPPPCQPQPASARGPRPSRLRSEMRIRCESQVRREKAPSADGPRNCKSLHAPAAPPVAPAAATGRAPAAAGIGAAAPAGRHGTVREAERKRKGVRPHF